MSWMKGVAARLRSLARPGGSEARMDEEFRFHIEMETEKNVRAGMSPREARRRAMIAFGGVERHREGMRDGRGLSWLRDAVRDAGYAVRTLARSPGFTLVSVLTVSLGVGATTALFSVVNALLLKPLPVHEPARLFTVQEERVGRVHSGAEGTSMPYERYLAYRAATPKVFSGLAAHRYLNLSVRTRSGAVPAGAMIASANYFQVLGMRPTAGRFFTADTEPAAVLSHRFWRERFGSDPAVVGQVVVLNGTPFTVAGVAPRGFDGTITGMVTEVWVPFEAYRAAARAGSLEDWVVPFGRLSAGVEREAAAARVSAVAKSIPPEEPHTKVFGAALEQMTGLPGNARRPLAGFLGMLLATGALVLLIASANIAGMLLARAVARRREVAVRLAIGAGRGRLVRQLVTESLVLFLAGGVGGMLLALAVTRAFGRIDFPVAERIVFEVTPDLRVLAFSLAIAAATGIGFGLVPALQATRAELLPGLKEGASHLATGRVRGRSLFVAAQLAMAVLLMVIAGLFARTLRHGLAVDPGFQPEDVLVSTTDLGPHGYDETRGRDFYRQLTERVRALPGVESAGLTDIALLAGSSHGEDVEAATPGAAEPRRVNVSIAVVDAGYFSTLRIPLATGRAITDADRPGSPRVVVVNQRLAMQLWPGENPLGKRLRKGSEEWEVVGVARDGKYASVSEEPRAFAFFPFAQSYSPRMVLHVRGGGAGLREMIRREVRALDPDIAVENQTALASMVGLTLLPQRVAAILVGVLGVLGLALAGIGVYGVLAYQVAQRTREFGIRLALGASARHVMRLVVGRGALLAAGGAAVGLLMAAGITRFLRSFLIGVSPLDPLTFAGVAVTLAAVALLASYLPARRAVRVDPMQALRAD
ncbi:MAG TPA: ABC transporter permease [Longimicrobium sp.]|jgi:predicted permease